MRRDSANICLSSEELKMTWLALHPGPGLWPLWHEGWRGCWLCLCDLEPCLVLPSSAAFISPLSSEWGPNSLLDSLQLERMFFKFASGRNTGVNSEIILQVLLDKHFFFSLWYVRIWSVGIQKVHGKLNLKAPSDSLWKMCIMEYRHMNFRFLLPNEGSYKERLSTGKFPQWPQVWGEEGCAVV